MAKKILKDTKDLYIPALMPNPEIYDKKSIQPLEISFGQEDLNKVVEKLNEIIDRLNKVI